MVQRQFKGLFKKKKAEIKGFETKNMATCHMRRKSFIQN